MARAAPQRLAALLGQATLDALGLMALRSLTIAGKFALTLFIARYLGLADLGLYGIITSIAVLAPVVLGFGVSNNLGREAARNGPASVGTRLLQYFLFLIPIYAVLCIVACLIFPTKAIWIFALTILMFLEHLQTDMFAVMMLGGRAYPANVVNFIRSAGWVIPFMPLALLYPELRNLETVGLWWLAGCAVATILTILCTLDWRWGEAIRALPSSKLELPHRHGSPPLYLNDVANTAFQYVDRYVVGIFLSPTLLGVYVLYWSIANAMNNLITTAIIQTRKGELVQIAQSSASLFNGRLRSVTILTSQMAIGMSIAAIALMYVVVPYINRPEVNSYLPLMFVLCAGLVVRTAYEVIGIAFYAYGRDDITLYSGILILAIGLVLNVSLDPVFGIWGAGAALLASYAIGVLIRSVVIRRGFDRSPAAVAAGGPK